MKDSTIPYSFLSMRSEYLFLLILFIGLVGCQKTTVFRSSVMEPLGLVRLEFQAQPRDASVEKVIEKRLFCSGCLFLKSSNPYERHSLVVEYRHLADAKSLGKFLLSGGMASIEDSRVTYTLKMRFVTEGFLVKEYSYSAVSREKIVGGMECLLNPFCDENGKAEEFFGQLTDEFLEDMLTDCPLKGPSRVTGNSFVPEG